MVDLIFTKVHAERFLSFPKLILEKHELIHPQAVYSIRGRDPELNTENAVGKSTVERIKYYGLYGEDLYPGVRADLISNFDIDGGHFVEIHFTLGGNDFMIQRFHDFVPYPGGPILEDSEKKTKYKGVRFYHVSGHDLRPIRGGSDTETQEIINKTLKLGPQAARTIFFIPQGVESPLLKANASTTQDILMELFPLEFVDKGRETNKEIMKGRKEGLLSMESALNLKEGLIESKEKDLSEIKKREFTHAEEQEKAVSEIKKSLAEAQSKSATLRKNAESLGDPSSLKAELKGKVEKIESLKNSAEIQSLKEEHLSKRELWASVSEEISQQRVLLKDPEVQLSVAQEFLKNTDLNAVKVKVNNLTDELELAKKDRSDTEARIKEIDAQIKRNNENFNRIELAKSSIGEKNKEIDRLLKDLGLGEEADLSLNKTSNEIKEEIEKLKQLQSSSRDRATEVATTVRSKKGELERIGKDDVCHACNRPFDKGHDHEAMKAALIAEIESLNQKLEAAQSESKELSAKALSLDGLLITTEKKERITSLRSDIRSLKDQTSQIEYNPSLSEELMREKVALQSKRKVGDIESDLKSAADILADYESKSEKVKDLSAMIKNVQVAIKSREDKLSEIRDEGVSLKKKIEDCEAAAKTEISLLEKQIEKATKDLGLLEEAMRCAEEAAKTEVNLKKDLAQKMSEKNPYTPIIERTSFELKELLREKAEIQERIKDANKDLLMYKFIDEMLSQNGIKSFVVDDTTEILNELIQENLKKFGFDGVLSVEFLPESMTSKGVIKSEIKKVFKLNGREVVWANFSGGQKARLSFCTNVAIRLIGEEKSGVRYHNPTFDEPFEGLCSTSQQIAMKILMDLAATRVGINIITHDRGLQTMFGGTLWLLKKGDFSYKVNKDIFEHPMSFKPKVEETYGDKKRSRKTTKKGQADLQVEIEEREVS